ncbi:uncharacterized protein LOC132698674 [Cylas formicarius]|uniref:uncharacterized protein LOC132698674 n=1 Tax=Cylas formicarius TaxID=197179 RepID=UPI00295883C4|nr:uncharacterized protein LOC132698674 [Cylas formicarius]
MKFLITVTCLALASIAVRCESYEGYKTYEVIPASLEQVEFLSELEYDDQFDFWSDLRRPGFATVIMVEPKAQDEFEKRLSDFQETGLVYKIIVENVEDTIKVENAQNVATGVFQIGGVTFERYMFHYEINNYLVKLAEQYPSIVNLELLGHSYEGRELYLIRISSGPGCKPTILIDAGIHAREWIAPPTALYIINQLVENATNRELYENIDWAIIPVLNPDGYSYTQTNARLWRKSRLPVQGSTCVGTDLNRNFDFNWMVIGASDNPCAETYAGPYAFSDVESRLLRDYILEHNDTIKLYLTIHSFGNMLLYPWGHTTELPDDAEELQYLGEIVSDAIAEVRGSSYVVGSTTNILYYAAGVTQDWAKGVAGVQLGYCIELPRGGAYGFNPPAAEIKGIVEETFEGIRVFHRYIQANKTVTCNSKMKFTLCAIILSCLILSSQGNGYYEGYKTYNVVPKTFDDVEFLRTLEHDTRFDFWSPLKRNPGFPTVIMASPEVQENFERQLTDLARNGLEYDIMIENVEDSVRVENMENIAPSNFHLGEVSFDRYMFHYEINDYLVKLAEEYPSIVQLELLGYSYEGRELYLIKISNGPGCKPTILVDAGIHAREWIAPPTALYIINQLVENATNARLYQNVNWAIIPVLNPDGYSFTQTDQRLWRKSRLPVAGSSCIGTDLNRNFDVHWMEVGASNNPCAETYAGPAPFSDVETSLLRNYLAKNNDTIKLYLTFHSYGNYILYPWGHTSALPPDADELQSLGVKAGNAIAAVRGSRYTVGSSTNVLYAAAGGSDDYAKGVAGVALSYCIELPAGGIYGFNPPASAIRGIVEETFEGVRVYHDYIEANKTPKCA